MAEDNKKIITIYKNNKKKGFHKVEESFGRKYICGPRTGNLWFLIKEEYQSHYEVYVSEL